MATRQQESLFASLEPEAVVERSLALEIGIILAAHIVVPEGERVRPTAEDLGKRIASLARRRFSPEELAKKKST